MKKIFLALVMGLALSVGVVYAKDDALAAPASVTVGERVAAYLQNYFNAMSSIVRARMIDQNTKKLFAAKPNTDALRANIFYAQTDGVITVLVVGNLTSTEDTKPVLQEAKKIIMSAAKTVSSNFGVTLTDNDIVMVYYSGAIMKPILKFKDGNYILPEDTVAAQ